MNLQENLKLFYLGTSNNEPFLYKNSDLTTHAIVIGMTGSGKTGLGITLLEEAGIDNIPSIIIDPKGDMANLALSFSKFEDFKEFLGDEKLATDAFNNAKNGLESSHQSFERVELFKNNTEIFVYTPKSEVGLGVNLLGSFETPKFDSLSELHEYTLCKACSLLSLINVKTDQTSPEVLLLQMILNEKFEKNLSFDFEELLNLIINPNFSKIGAFDLETFFPKKDRTQLAMKLNALIASPDFSLWCRGEALELSKMLFDKNGKARANIFNIAHLNDEQRMFFVSLLLNEVVSFMRGLEGTDSLRMIVYMDEIFGYFPPNGNPPSKGAMLTLLKQARAYGVGVVLSTQNPVDIDYKGLSNIGTWFIGRLQTAQDKDRVMGGLSGVGSMSNTEISDAIGSLKKREFIVKNIHRDGLLKISTRWALNYLFGPLNKDQIKALTSHKVQTIAPKINLNKTIVSDCDEIYEDARSGEFKPYLLARAKVDFVNKDGKISKEVAYIYDTKSWEILDDIRLTEQRPEASFLDVPSEFLSKNLKNKEREFVDFVYRNETQTSYKALNLTSKPGQSKEEFLIDLQDKCNEILEVETEKFTQKFEKEKKMLELRLTRANERLQKEKQQESSSMLNAAISIGAGLFGAFFGKGGVSAAKVATASRSATRVLNERADSASASARVEEANLALDELILDYESKFKELRSKYDARNFEIEEREISPKKSDIYDIKLMILWRAV